MNDIYTIYSNVCFKSFETIRRFVKGKCFYWFWQIATQHFWMSAVHTKQLCNNNNGCIQTPQLLCGSKYSESSHWSGKCSRNCRYLLPRRGKICKKASYTELFLHRFLSSQSWEIGSPPTGGAGRMKLSCVVPVSVIHIWPIHISWGKILHLCVSAVNVFWHFATFWWSAIILLEKGKI